MEPRQEEQVDRVRLVDLEIIKRYSLAVRQEWAPAEELLAVLDATREEVRAAIAVAIALDTDPDPKRPRARSRRRSAADREP